MGLTIAKKDTCSPVVGAPTPRERDRAVASAGQVFIRREGGPGPVGVAGGRVASLECSR